jgi:hypothetical protein
LVFDTGVGVGLEILFEDRQRRQAGPTDKLVVAEHSVVDAVGRHSKERGGRLPAVVLHGGRVVVHRVDDHHGSSSVILTLVDEIRRALAGRVVVRVEAQFVTEQ